MHKPARTLQLGNTQVPAEMPLPICAGCHHARSWRRWDVRESHVP